MSGSHQSFIVDPLKDHFWLRDLHRYAPWVAERISAVGEERVRAAVTNLGQHPDQPQRMDVWVSAVTRCEDPGWADENYWHAA